MLKYRKWWVIQYYDNQEELNALLKLDSCLELVSQELKTDTGVLYRHCLLSFESPKSEMQAREHCYYFKYTFRGHVDDLDVLLNTHYFKNAKLVHKGGLYE